jgi:predicted negative regulator of RcsB-dependent stress response
MALLQKGDRAEARKELEAALRNRPEPEDRAKIEDLMRRIG